VSPQVWDREIIQTALADFYGKDMDAFRKQLEHNLTKASERDWLSDSDISLVPPGKETCPQCKHYAVHARSLAGYLVRRCIGLDRLPRPLVMPN
jgi:hypothetical protein